MLFQSALVWRLYTLMKKIFVAAALFIASMSAYAEVIQRDTVVYTGTYEPIEKISENDFGERSVRHYVVINNGDKERKVVVDKRTYEVLTQNKNATLALVYTTNDKGNKRIAKAIVKQ